MKYTIYQITNIINNKIYIGKHQTNDVNDNYMGSGKHLKRALNKHGIDSFVKQILYVFNTEEEMNIKEAELVTEEFCLREDTYNICIGGLGGFSYINNNKLNLYGENGINGAEILKKQGKIHREKLITDQEYASNYKKAVSIGLIEYYKRNDGVEHFHNKKHSIETKEKIGYKNSIKQSGSGNSQYGRPRSKETKEKIRQSLLNRKSNSK